MRALSSPCPTILFVDDEAQVLSSLRRGLHRRRPGWEMAFEVKPRAAIQQVLDTPPNVVVTDLNMPELTGIEMILEMRNAAPKTTVFILLTGAGDLQSAIAAINHANIFRFLTKPCPIDTLAQAINEGLAWQRQQTESRQGPSSGFADAALDRLSTAVVVVDRDCQVMYLNECASDVIAAKDGLVIDRNGACRAPTPDLSQMLRSLVRQAAVNGDDTVRYLSLPTRQERRDLQVVIEAVSDTHVALFLADPQRQVVPTPQGLQDLFGLTKAEALVAHALASGGSLEDASTAGGITVSSARTYLKRVFSKTGVNRQAELMQLVLSAPTPVPRGPETQLANTAKANA